MKDESGQTQISMITQIISILCGIALIIVIFVPIWRIQLDAPQYPEGLEMQIHANKLAGDVEIINGLNHYIGMRTLHKDDFVEFTVLPYIFGFFAIFGFITAKARKKKLFYIWALAFFLFAILAMVDFYNWEYEYGHNLDPTAAIKVPGQAYQPPLIGFKQLLNFGAYSFPAIGGWLMLLVGLALLGCLIFELRNHKPFFKCMLCSKRTAALILMIQIVFIGCSSGPKPIHFESDNCDFCKMTISDSRFGAEIVTKKGKVFKFDDLHCIKAFLKDGEIDTNEIGAIYFVDFSIEENLIEASKSYLFQADQVNSPMGSNTVAFGSKDSLETYQTQFSGKEVTWEEYLKN